MGVPLFADAIGTVDGVNTDFAAPVPYTPGSLAYYRNGQLQPSQAYSELDPSAGTFRVVDPLCVPRTGPGSHVDDVQVFFLDTSDDTPIREIDDLFGVLEDETIAAELEQDDLVATLVEDGILGAIAEEVVRGSVDVDELVGQLEDC